MKRDPLPLILGVLITTIISGTLVIAGLKAGITPGVSPLVILFAWGAFTKRIAGGKGSRFLNIAQVAGSAGMAVTAGVIFTAPLLQILHTDLGIATMLERGLESELPHRDGEVLVGRELLEVLADNGLAVPPVETKTIMLLSLAGALIGFGFVGLGTRKFLTDPTLPAPEARACETMIRTAVDDPARRPRLAPSLYLGLGASFLAPLVSALGAANAHVTLWQRAQAGREFKLDLPLTPIYIGIGGLLSLATALLVFGGAMLRLVGDYLLAGISPESAAALTYPANSMRWVGGGAMTVAVAYSLVRFLGLKTSHGGAEDPLVEITPRARKIQWAAILAGVAVLFSWMLSKDGPSGFTFAMTAAVLACCSLMVVLGAILSLQIGSSASPVSGTIFVSTLVLCLVALAVGHDQLADVRLLMPLLVGACVAVCTANDSSQDYKTMQLCGIRVQEGFLAQFLGLCAGCIVVPIVLGIAHEAYVLGSDDLVAPQGKMFATLITGLLLESQLPWTPILIGLAIGVGAVLMDIAGSKKGLQLPAMALAVGIYLPAYLGVGILIGSLFRWFGEGKHKQTNESILTAAGLITGAALFELILGSMIVFGNFDPKRLLILDWNEPVSFLMNRNPADVLGVIGIVILGGILYINSRPQRAR